MNQIEALGTDRVAHRQSQRLFGKGTLVRHELRNFATGDEPLENYFSAWVAVQELSLVSLVERTVEAIHAQLKRAGKAITNPRAPYLCAILREWHNLSALKDDRAFYDFCVKRWRSRVLLASLLSLRFTSQELSRMKRLAKVQAVYQCGLSSQFEDTSDARQWSIATSLASTMDATRVVIVGGVVKVQVRQELFLQHATSFVRILLSGCSARPHCVPTPSGSVTWGCGIGRAPERRPWQWPCLFSRSRIQRQRNEPW